MKKLIATWTAMFYAAGQTAVFAATGEVTLSGGIWTGKVDGATVFTGSSMASAANACVNAMSSGTVNIRNAGDKNGVIRIKSNITVDGHSVTISGGGTAGIVYAQNSSGIGARNIAMASTDWFGVLFRTCANQNSIGTRGTANLAFRVDNCRGGAGSSYTVGSPTSSTLGSHASHYVETFGVNGVSWGLITASDRTDGSGTQLNLSSAVSGSGTTATRCDFGGGFSGFRVANNNRTTTLSTLRSISCGRGFMSVGSTGTTLNSLDAQDGSGHGVLLQNTGSTRVNGGTVRNCNPCSAISGDLGGNSITVTCQ